MLARQAQEQFLHVSKSKAKNYAIHVIQINESKKKSYDFDVDVPCHCHNSQKNIAAHVQIQKYLDWLIQTFTSEFIVLHFDFTFSLYTSVTLINNAFICNRYDMSTTANLCWIMNVTISNSFLINQQCVTSARSRYPVRTPYHQHNNMQICVKRKLIFDVDNTGSITDRDNGSIMSSI